MKSIMQSVLLLLVFAFSVSAQFQFFEQFFGGEQQHQKPQNAPSDSNWYRDNYAKTRCSNYLCPDTLACVHFPHHCPCAFPVSEDKVELGDGIAICASKGGYKSSETSRKIELARKGLL